MNKWDVIYFINPSSNENPVKKFIDGLQVREQVKIFRVFQHIQTYGLISILPHVKKITGYPLWEIRILGKDSVRILYVVAHKETVLLLHGFRKKTQQTPEKEISIAFSRYEKWKQLFDK